MDCEEVVFTNEVILPFALYESLVKPELSAPKITEREAEAISVMWSAHNFALQDFCIYVQHEHNSELVKVIAVYQNTLIVDGVETKVIAMMFPVDYACFAEINFFLENGAIQAIKSVNDAYNSWLDYTPEDAINRIRIALLSVFNYIQSKMQCEMKHIKRSKTQVLEKQHANVAKHKCKCKPVRVADFQYRYVYDPHETTRNYMRHVDAWGVRGHYRHYKSGKVVFIHPHTRGSGAVKHTQYTVGDVI